MLPSALCAFDGSQFLIFGPNVAPLVYYSHLATGIIALVLGIYIYLRDRRALPNQILFIITLTFAVWVFLDQIFWATNRSDIVMFTWAAIVLIEPLVHIAGLYLLYVLVKKRDIPFVWKVGLFLLYLPLIIAGPTNFNLVAFDITTCLAEEGPIAQYYSYGLEIFAMIAVLIFAIFSFDRAKDREHRKKILVLSFGIFLLMFAFSWGNIIGSFTDNWEIAQYGLFGMPIFIGFLMYAIVKYRAFNIKLIGAVVLIFALIASSFSLLFVNDVSVFRGVAGTAFFLSSLFGIMLVRGVTREAEQLEHIEKLAEELQETNTRQETLMHFVGHEVKGYLTRDASAFAALVEGDFGELPEPLKPIVNQALAQSRDGARSVTDILTASNQKKGTMTYAKEPFDLKALIVEIVDKFKPKAEDKGLTLSFSADDSGAPYTFNGDKEKIGDNVLRNIIDNSINYTQSGSVAVSLKKENLPDGKAGNKFVISIKDTGIGITPEDKKLLFTEGGHGKDSQKVNVHSTGYGLFIAKNIVEAHGGTIRAESLGAGKGSTFIVELPA